MLYEVGETLVEVKSMQIRDQIRGKKGQKPQGPKQD